MRVLLVCMLALSAAYLVSAQVTISTARSVVFNRQSVPKEYAFKGFASPSSEITFVLGMKQQNLDKLTEMFWAVSTPGNAQYRQFKTEQEILDLIAPSNADRQTVLSWLRAHKIYQIQDRRDSLQITTTVEIAEQLFQTKFYIFYNSQRRVNMIRSFGAYSMPNTIRAIVDIVAGISDFPLNANRLHMSPEQTFAVVPQTLQAQYSIPSTASASNVNQGVIEFGSGEYFNPVSLGAFAQGVNININNLTNNHIITPLPPTGIEGTLDIQYIASIGYDATNWYWTDSDWLYTWSTTFFAASSKPEVVSISYGWSELAQCDIDPNECQTLGVDSSQYVKKVDTEFQKIGLTGVSLLSASGDSGANGRTDPDCTVPQLRAAYPGVSPYITSVGATQLNNPGNSLNNPPPVCNTGDWDCFIGGTESAVSYDVSNFASGGGFSWINSRPSYQAAAVEAYLKSGVQLPPSSYYNATGRAHPDVASLGSSILIYSQQEGGWATVGGTSASSPSFAGYVSLLNQVAKSKDGKPLGFLNPFLYKMYADSPSCFTDITVGDNICTEDGCASSCEGFYCAKGWDPVTGLGVANVANMLKYVEAQL